MLLLRSVENRDRPTDGSQNSHNVPYENGPTKCRSTSYRDNDEDYARTVTYTLLAHISVCLSTRAIDNVKLRVYDCFNNNKVNGKIGGLFSRSTARTEKPPADQLIRERNRAYTRLVMEIANNATLIYNVRQS